MALAYTEKSKSKVADNQSKLADQPKGVLKQEM